MSLNFLLSYDFDALQNSDVDLSKSNQTETARIIYFSRKYLSMSLPIEEIDFQGKKALIRVDFNVPLDENFYVTDETRIRASLATIKYILQKGGAVVLMSHLGRPKGGPEDKFSLKHLIPKLCELLNQPVAFSPNCIGAIVEKTVEDLSAGEVLLLENLRFHKEETAGDLAFAEALSKNGDIYINDAFGTAHRAHASTAIIAQFFEEKTFGFLIERELASVQRVLDQVARPYTAIVGGAKVSSKIDIVRNLLQKVDRIVIGGGMAFTFIKAQGGSIGTSLVEDEQLETALTILREAKEKGVQIILPTDSKIADAFDNNANTQICKINEIPEGWMGLDIGPESMECMRESLLSSNTILWNGPMGVFEMSSFSEGTERVGQAVAEATEAGAFSLVGGGDSVAAVNQFGLSEHVSYVSTAGGALLEFLEGKKLPGIAAIRP